MMKRCRECAFLNRNGEKGNYVCSIEKMRHPGSPGLYIRNPNSQACEKNFREKMGDRRTQE